MNSLSFYMYVYYIYHAWWYMHTYCIYWTIQFLLSFCTYFTNKERFVLNLLKVVHIIIIFKFLLCSGKAEEDVQFGPNLNEFVRRFDVETTNGQGTSVYKQR